LQRFFKNGDSVSEEQEENDNVTDLQNTSVCFEEMMIEDEETEIQPTLE